MGEGPIASRLIAAAALASALVVAPLGSAQAASLKRLDRNLIFRAAQGEANALVVSVAEGAFGFLDSGARIDAGAGCSGGGAPGEQASCRSKGIRRVLVSTRDLGDRLELPGTSEAVIIEAFAGGGPDQAVAADTSASNTIWGGPGADDLEVGLRWFVWGGWGADRIETRGSWVIPGSGFDRIYVENGRPDTLSCVFGYEIVTRDEIETAVHPNCVGVGYCDHEVVGTARRDALGGGEVRDLILGFGGGDTIRGGTGDCLDGGKGDDLLLTIGRAFILEGKPGEDRLIGARHADYLYGGAQNDVLQGRGGKDNLFGGLGEDLLMGGSEADEIFSRDGSADRILCGHGAGDRAYVDGRDLVHDCERVELKPARR